MMKRGEEELADVSPLLELRVGGGKAQKEGGWGRRKGGSILPGLSTLRRGS